MTQNGTDANGFILEVPDAPVQSDFQNLLRDLCSTLVAEAPLLLDSIYLYGSVARGEAVPRVSDLDVTLVLSHEGSSPDLENIEALRKALAARHPEVVKIDFDIGHRAEVLAADNLFSWGYWLKHHCRCIWGNNLGQRFAPFRPSRAIAVAVNGDFEAVLNRYAERIEQTIDINEQSLWQREAARKLIRATNILRSDQDRNWPRTLDEHAEQFARHYPSMKTQIESFLVLAKTPTTSVKEFSTQLRNFVQWMAGVRVH